ncbi:MAG: hypothetical protein C0594_12615, partial [Marinilabiliales bacterium]
SSNINHYSSSSIINLYPNPTKENFTIQIQSDKPEDYIMNIMNNMGELILTKKEKYIQNKKINIKLENQPSGLYFVSIMNDHETINKKIIKQ